MGQPSTGLSGTGSPSAEPVQTATAHAFTSAATTVSRLQRQAGSPPELADAPVGTTPAAPARTVPTIGAPGPVFLPTPGSTELLLPPPVFDVGVDRPGAAAPAVQRAGSEPAVGSPRGPDRPETRGWDSGSDGIEQVVDSGSMPPPQAMAPVQIAPLLGKQPSGPVPAAAPSVSLPPAVQRHPLSSAFLEQPVQRTASSIPQTARAAGTGGGFGAPLHSLPPTAAGGSGVAREMSLAQMFAPGAAAIASGAAHSDAPGSVVFSSPTSAPMTTNPTLGSSFDTAGIGSPPAAGSYAGSSAGVSVQRLGLPSASAFVSDARQRAGGYADTARQAAGGYAGRAGQAASGDVDAATGYAHTALATAGHYTDAAGQAAGGLSDTAGSAVDGAAAGATGAAGGAVDAASGAAGGLAEAGTAASGVTTTAAGAAGAAAGAVGAAAGGTADALPTDLDELARRLFDPLSARLKSELWLDRERAGMVTDLRR
jgi:hypothetical protein